MHGLLHSGGRYAVSDRPSATECIEENRVRGETRTRRTTPRRRCTCEACGIPVDPFADLDGIAVADVGDPRPVISGTYGWRAEKYDTSMAIGEGTFDHVEDVAGTTGMTERPTCTMQMEHGTGYDVRHPLELLEAALVP